MDCCQCQGIEEVFSQQHVSEELSDYRAKGADKTTCMLAEAIRAEGLAGQTLLDIGGGVGAIQHELLNAGVEQAIDVDASTAYLSAAKEEARRRGYGDRMSFYHGNFVDLAEDVTPADIVTLDRVICCYPDMEKLVNLSAARARKTYGLVYPRDTWWIKAGIAVRNLFNRLRGNHFRGFIHPTKGVDAILAGYGFRRKTYRRTLTWQVVVYTRSVD